MKDYVERMLAEFNELQERTEKLNLFICTNEAYKQLPKEKTELMLLQLDAMRCYMYALEKRIHLEEQEK